MSGDDPPTTCNPIIHQLFLMENQVGEAQKQTFGENRQRTVRQSNLHPS